MSELQQIVSKVKPNGTHINTANYWAPLADEDNGNVCNKAAPAQQATINNVCNAEGKASTMVVDSGATSSFVWWEENLPITRLSSKVVNLPNGSMIQATHTTMLPFESLQLKQEKQMYYQGCNLTHWSVLANLPTQTTPQYSTHAEKA
jgi:hypothetical protein